MQKIKYIVFIFIIPKSVRLFTILQFSFFLYIIFTFLIRSFGLIKIKIQKAFTTPDI